MRKATICAVLGLLITGSAANATYSISTVKKIGSSGSIVLFETEGRSQAAACQASGSPNTWTIDITQDAGRTQYAMLLSAYALHKRVYIDGTNGCDPRTNVETITFLQLYDD